MSSLKRKITVDTVQPTGAAYEGFDGLLTGIIVCEGNAISYVNPAFERMIGQSLQQLQKQDVGQASQLLESILRFAKDAEGKTVAQDIVQDEKGTKYALYSSGQGVVEVVVLPHIETDQATLDFAAQILGHEMRTPLASLKGAAQLLAKQSPDSDMSSKLVDIIDGEVERLSMLSRSVDTLVGVKDIEIAPTDINRIIHSVWASNENVSLALDPSIPEVQGQGGLVEIMLDNLVRNALEADDKCTVRTGYDPTYHDGAEKYPIYISVSNACEDVLDTSTVFEPFVSTKGSGRGLGLAIVKKLSTAMGAKLSLSQSGNTVTFSIHFKLEKRG